MYLLHLRDIFIILIGQKQERKKKTLYNVLCHVSAQVHYHEAQNLQIQHGLIGVHQSIRRSKLR